MIRAAALSVLVLIVAGCAARQPAAKPCVPAPTVTPVTAEQPAPPEQPTATVGQGIRLGYTILYVKDVAGAVAFYEAAFGLKRRFIHESGQYAELQTGQTTLAFASLEAAAGNLPEGVRPASEPGKPGAFEIALLAPDVKAAFERAVKAGAVGLAAPVKKPWGQTVGYLRDKEGHLIELATPMSAPGLSHRITILAVADVKKSLAFYRAAFGWPVAVDAPVYKELKLPGGGGIGLYQREGFAKNVGATPVQAPAGKVTGTELYLHVDDLAGAIKKLMAAGARPLSPLGPRPWGDQAAYFADPDHNIIVLARPQKQ